MTGISMPTFDAVSTALVGANLMLGTLQNNTGLTDTMLPAAGSPLINAGSNAILPAGLNKDQRDLVRIFGSAVDIGSVEVQPIGVPFADVTAADVTVAGATSYTFTVTFSDPNGTNNGFDITTINGANKDNVVRVTGPNGFDAQAFFVSVDVASNGWPRTVTYTITPPGGDWDGPTPASTPSTFRPTRSSTQRQCCPGRLGGYIPGGHFADVYRDERGR